MTAGTLTERDFQWSVVELARLQCWSVFHHHDSRRSEPGWPDLVLLRPPEALFVELKTDRGRVSPAQTDTIDLLQGCGLEVHLWRPRDWPEIEQRLRLRRDEGGATPARTLSRACRPDVSAAPLAGAYDRA